MYKDSTKYPSAPATPGNGRQPRVSLRNLFPDGVPAMLPVVRCRADDEAMLLALPLQQEEGIYRVRVTPQLAGRWLDNNRDNRFVKPRVVKFYARQMKASKWKVNGECIKFSREGRLTDGQHRLRAIIEAGVTVELEVRVGLPEDTVLTVDTGSVRSATDVMSMRGLTQWEAGVLAGAIRLLINHERTGAMWAVYHADNREVDDYFSAHQTLYLSLRSIRTSGGHRNRLYPFPLAVALHHLFALVGPGDADDFFYRLYGGVAIVSDEPLHWLRQYCETDLDRTARTRQTYDLAIRTVKCWNLTRDGEPVQSKARLAPKQTDSRLPEIH